MANATTYQDVIGKHLSEAARKNYFSSIRQMRLKLSAEETAEYVDHRGMLIKCLHYDVATRILHECQIWSVEAVEDTSSVLKFKSQNTAVTYSSAMKFWHKESNRVRDPTVVPDPIIISHDLVAHLSSYTAGRRRMTAEDRANGEESDFEGKYPIDMSEFRVLAKSALTSGVRPKDARLYHAYLILCWNLIARSSTVGDLLWNNISWKNDCITVLYEKGKTNQEGMNKVPWHVYANPNDPLICPVLALGLKLCTESDTFANIPFKVFPSSTSDNSFSAWMRKTVDELAQDPEILISVPPDRIGTHSLRKGAASYVDGLTDGPNTDSVKLRMEHRLGGCDYRYIFRGAGNDAYVGRSVSGLDTCSVDMGALPPHFRRSTIVNDVICQSIVSRASNSFKKAFPFMIASVIHHWDWLIANLPGSHPFFTSRIYTSGIYETWKPLVITGMFKCKETKMTASGLPKIIVNLLETRLVHDAVLASPRITADLVLDAIGSVDNVNFHNEGVLNRTLSPRFENIERSISNLSERFNQVQPQSPPTTRVNFRTFSWGGRFHNHPEDFQLPADTCVKLWNLWLFGDSNAVNIPYRNLVGTYMKNSAKIRLTRTKKVLDRIQMEIGISYQDLTAMGPVEAEKTFIETFAKIFGDIRNYSNMQLSNVYKHDLKARRPAKTQSNPRRLNLDR